MLNKLEDGSGHEQSTSIEYEITYRHCLPPVRKLTEGKYLKDNRRDDEMTN